MILTNRKNIERKPKTANILEKNTIYGSFVTEKIAGIESTAKIKSVNSITNNTKNRGVMYLTPFSMWKNRPPSMRGVTLKYLDMNLTTGWFWGSTSSSLFLFKYIIIPVYTKKAPKT